MPSGFHDGPSQNSRLPAAAVTITATSSTSP
jgi:hypothetical protein